jgi:hypothetical protein
MMFQDGYTFYVIRLIYTTNVIIKVLPPQNTTMIDFSSTGSIRTLII